jgi:hypothetical protein
MNEPRIEKSYLKVIRFSSMCRGAVKGCRCRILRSDRLQDQTGFERRSRHVSIMGPGGRTHNGANHPIRHWQAMESDRHLTTRTEPRRMCDVNRESGTQSANRGWLQ